MVAEMHTLKIKCTANDDDYVDLASVMTAFNHRQYHQVEADGTPNVYHGRVRAAEADTPAVDVITAPNNWITRNAVKKTSIGWKKQLKRAGVKIKDLSPYGRRFRTTLDENGQTNINRAGGGGSPATVTVRGLAKNFVPVDADGTAIFSGYTDSSDRPVTYASANTITELAVTDAAGTDSIAFPCLTGTGTGATDFFIIDEFLRSRRQMDTYEEDTPGPTSTNKMTSLFNTAEELSDDIIEAVEDFGDNRPYDNGSAADQLYQWGTCGSTAGTTEAVPSAEVSFSAPLGLLKLKGGRENAIYYIDLMMISEM